MGPDPYQMLRSEEQSIQGAIEELDREIVQTRETWTTAQHRYSELVDERKQLVARLRAFEDAQRMMEMGAHWHGRR